MSWPRISDKADLQLFNVPYFAPDSNNWVKNIIIFGTDPMYKLILLDLQNMNHFFKQVSYCFTELSESDANIIGMEDEGRPFFRSDVLITYRQPG